MNHQQLELWNDTPESWRKRMEDDAFEIAFPGEKRVEGDEVTVFMDYREETEGWGYSSWTWEPGTDSQFVIEVRWFTPGFSNYNPNNKRPGTRLKDKKVYERQDALEFWLRLMKKGKQ